MRISTWVCLPALTVAAFASVAAPVSAQQAVRVEITNLSPTDGFFLTPLWVGLHGGDFDLFDIDGTASPGLEALAEDGVIGTLSGEFAQPGRLEGVAANPAGFPGAPVIDTGETARVDITTINPVAYRYLSFASMVIPSNDAFIGNEDPFAYELFDASGAFNGPLVIDLVGADIWDAGTEVNDTLGAAFSAIGMTDSDENGTVQQHPGLANFEGTDTAAGFTIGAGLAPGLTTPVARISVSLVPEPAAIGLVGLSVVAAAARRRQG